MEQEQTTNLANPEANANPEQDLQQPQESQPQTPQEQEQDPRQERVSSRFAALTRKERELQKQQQEIKQMMNDPVFQNFRTAREKKDAKAALEALGMSFDDLAQYTLNDNQLTPEQRIKQLEERIENERKEREELDKQKEMQQNEAVIQNFKQDIAATIDNDPDSYELVKLNEAQEAVYNLIEQNYQNSGELLSIEDAAAQVEEFLQTRLSKIMENSKKLKGAKPEGDSQDTPSLAKKTSEPTLTNNNYVAQPDSSEDYLDDNESKRRAAQMLQQALKGE